ncbi:hypothetical protein GGI35DRAFT_477107 [Trichoderma velutinum]
MALRVARYCQGFGRSENWPARTLSWSNSSRLHQARYGLNTGQMLSRYTTKSNTKDGSRKASRKKWKSKIIRLSPTKGLKQPIEMPFTRLEQGTWLHNRPETDVYKILAETYRLLVAETLFFESEPMEGILVNGSYGDRDGFRIFLRQAAAIQGLLPPWWSKENEAACVHFLVYPLGWPQLPFDDKMRGIMDHYGDRLFPLQLRMLAEAVYGNHPSGLDARSMRELLMREERGELNSQVIGDSKGTILTTVENGNNVVYIWL